MRAGKSCNPILENASSSAHFPRRSVDSGRLFRLVPDDLYQDALAAVAVEFAI
jgi:hypothetical protein